MELQIWYGALGSASLLFLSHAVCFSLILIVIISRIHAAFGLELRFSLFSCHFAVLPP